MKLDTIKTNDGEEVTLTEQEQKFFNAIKRLEKMNPGRICLFGNGRLSVRMNDGLYADTFYNTSIQCEGGDGGDN